MSTHEPEPLPEFAPGGIVEQRGGDRPEDYLPFGPPWHSHGAFPSLAFTDDSPDAGEDDA